MGGEGEPSADKTQAIKELRTSLQQLRHEEKVKMQGIYEHHRWDKEPDPTSAFPNYEDRLKKEKWEKAKSEQISKEQAQLAAEYAIKKTDAYTAFIRKWGAVPPDIEEPDPNATVERTIPPAEPTKSEEKPEPRTDLNPPERPAAEPTPMRRDDPTPKRPPGGV